VHFAGPAVRVRALRSGPRCCRVGQAAGIITGQRLCQLVRRRGGLRDRTFAIEFLDPGAQAFAFTFG